MSPEEILKEAAGIAEGKRSTHGAENSFRLIADLWSTYLNLDPSSKLHPSDVAQMMVLLKMARSRHGSFNKDDYVDQAGYSGWAGALLSEQS